MSAWLVSKDHTRVLVQAGILYGLVDAEEADRLATDLYQECAKSVTYRYDHRDDIAFERAAQTDTVTYRPATPASDNPIPFWLKQIHCYQCQACEHPGWDSSAAKAWTEHLETRLLQVPTDDQFTRFCPSTWCSTRECEANHPPRYHEHLKGYSDAPWGFDGDE